MTQCDHCGALSQAALEFCPQCGAFESLLPVEEPVAPLAPSSLSQDASEIGDSGSRPVSTGFEAWDEALGGGLVLGSSVVVYGGEGARKSTWCSAISDHVATVRRGVFLWLSAEMPAYMARDTVVRVRKPRSMRIIGTERDSPNLAQDLAEVVRLRPRVVLYDSIQAFDAVGAMAGSDFAVAATVKQARRLAATLGHVAILISQVNKAGLPAGPHRTVHDCDVIVRLDPRKVTVTKNRFAPARSASLSA